MNKGSPIHKKTSSEKTFLYCSSPHSSKLFVCKFEIIKQKFYVVKFNLIKIDNQPFLHALPHIRPDPCQTGW